MWNEINIVQLWKKIICVFYSPATLPPPNYPVYWFHYPALPPDTLHFKCFPILYKISNLDDFGIKYSANILILIISALSMHVTLVFNGLLTEIHVNGKTPRFKFLLTRLAFFLFFFLFSFPFTFSFFFFFPFSFSSLRPPPEFKAWAKYVQD